MYHGYFLNGEIVDAMKVFCVFKLLKIYPCRRRALSNIKWYSCTVQISHWGQCQSVDSLQWRHSEHDSVSNHQPHDYLFNFLLRSRTKKTSKLHVTGPCEGNPPVTGEFPAQRASNAENASIWWRHHTMDIILQNAVLFDIPIACFRKIKRASFLTKF